MKTIKKTVLFLYLLLVFIISLFFFYYLPSGKTVHLVGTEVKREVKTSKSKGDVIKDVRYVVAREIPTNKTLMYRNEDVPWPPYFKFDSGDLSGKVMTLEESDPDAIVLLKYYGFRLPIFSVYPNVTSVVKVEKGYQYTPWLKIVVFVIFGIVALWNLIKLLKTLYWRKPKKDRREGKVAQSEKPANSQSEEQNTQKERPKQEE